MNMTKYVIHYILHNEPHSVEVECDKEELTLDQARAYLNSIHCFEWPNDFIDVQVARILPPPTGAPNTGQHVQR
jgi:hypothetical protein